MDICICPRGMLLVTDSITNFYHESSLVRYGIWDTHQYDNLNDDDDEYEYE